MKFGDPKLDPILGFVVPIFKLIKVSPYKKSEVKNRNRKLEGRLGSSFVVPILDFAVPILDLAVPIFEFLSFRFLIFCRSDLGFFVVPIWDSLSFRFWIL